MLAENPARVADNPGRRQHGVDPRLKHARGPELRGGSGSGINLSNIRGSMEPLAKGGIASGPVSSWRPAVEKGSTV
jgi:hypothetical protein